MTPAELRRLDGMLCDLAEDCGRPYREDAIVRAVHQLAEEVGARLKTPEDWARLEDACRGLRRTIAERKAKGEWIGRFGPFDLALAFRAAPKVYDDPPCPRNCGNGVLTATGPDGWSFAIACDCPRGMRIRESSGNPLRESRMPEDVLRVKWRLS